jgi:hypothetical protein
MTIYEGVKLLLTKGDIITSKKGILLKGFEEQEYIVFKLKYLGNGKWENLGEKQKTSSRKIDI